MKFILFTILFFSLFFINTSAQSVDISNQLIPVKQDYLNIDKQISPYLNNLKNEINSNDIYKGLASNISYIALAWLIILIILKLITNKIGSIDELTEYIKSFFSAPKRPDGIILDMTNSKSIPFARIEIFSKESKKLIKVVYSDIDGNFFMNLARDEYLIKIKKGSYLKYDKTNYIDNISYYIGGELKYSYLILPIKIMVLLKPNATLTNFAEWLIKIFDKKALLSTFFLITLLIQNIYEPVNLSKVTLVLFIFFSIFFTYRYKITQSLEIKILTIEKASPSAGVLVNIYDKFSNLIKIGISDKNGSYKTRLLDGTYYIDTSSKDHLDISPSDNKKLKFNETFVKVDMDSHFTIKLHNKFITNDLTWEEESQKQKVQKKEK